MRLVIALITKDRADKTEETLRTFNHYNGWCARAVYDTYCVHGDDGSVTWDNHKLAHTFGFKTIVANDVASQLGAHAMRRRVIQKSIELHDPTHILVLENDWRCVRPLPWNAIEHGFRYDDVYAFRLYGEQKQEDGTRPAGAEHAGRGKADPKWCDINLAGETYEIGDIHFGAPPCIFRAEELVWLHEGTSSDSKSMRKSGQIDKRTVRVKENVFWHIGYDRTPGFRR